MREIPILKVTWDLSVQLQIFEGYSVVLDSISIGTSPVFICFQQIGIPDVAESLKAALVGTNVFTGMKRIPASIRCKYMPLVRDFHLFCSQFGLFAMLTISVSPYLI